jgi:hypothetical protein
MANKFKRGPQSGSVINFPDQDRKLVALASTLLGRAAVAARAGYSYGTQRDLYAICGYPREIQFEQYLARYIRQDVARRVVRAPVDATWRQPPEVTENEDNETAFEKAVTDLIRTRRLWHYLARADRLSGIGRYGVLLLGLDDARTEDDLRNPATRATALLYLQPYHEGNATVKSYITNPTDPRYGMPELYDIRTGVMDSLGAQAAAIRTLTVHHTRVIHVAEDTEDNDVYGTPRLQAVYNRLQDLELIAAGGSEMFWRGAYPGMGFSTKEGFTLDATAMADLEDEINEYLHGLKRYMRLNGLDVNQLAAQVADPEGHVNVLIALISAATGIPQRILTGSERGELASSQDRENWADRVDERRNQHVTPVIVRGFLDRMIDLGVIPAPAAADGYEVEWPEIYQPNDQEQATVAQVRTTALAAYASTPGIETFMPRRFYLRKYQGLTDAELDELEAEATQAQAEEDEEAELERSQKHEDMELEAELKARTAAAAKPATVGTRGPAK